MKVQVALPPRLIDVFLGDADVRGAYGGRGSGKTRSFAKMTAVQAVRWEAQGLEGMILCCRQFMNSLADSSLEEIKAAIRSESWLEAQFDIGEKYIKTKSGRIYYSFTGLDRNIQSVKSKARILLCWVDEAEPVTEQAWQTLIPTIREDVSELWVTWNPERKNSATHKRFRESQDSRMKVVELNWRDNPKFPEILDRQRIRDKQERPDTYDHIWEGDFVSVVEGAYFATCLTQAKAEHRIGHVAADPYLIYRAFADIGGTGAKADAFVLWIAQFVGKEIRVLDHYEVQGQPLASHLNWLREKGYVPSRTKIWLPHDGATHDKVFDVSYESGFRAAGFDVEVVPNQGKGAAMQRIESARRKFAQMWFNESTTESGRDAIGWYHEKRDENRAVGMGPNHDWSSHSADAFGLMSIVHDQPEFNQSGPIRRAVKGIV